MQNLERSISQISFNVQGKSWTLEEMEGDENDLIKYKQFEKNTNHLNRQIGYKPNLIW